MPTKIELHSAEHAHFLTLAQAAGNTQQKAHDAAVAAQQFVAMLAEKAGIPMPRDASNLQAVREDGKYFLQWTTTNV